MFFVSDLLKWSLAQSPRVRLLNTGFDCNNIIDLQHKFFDSSDPSGQSASSSQKYEEGIHSPLLQRA